MTLVDSAAVGTATNAAAGIISALDDNPPNDEWSGYAFPAMRYYRELAAELEELDEKDHSLRVLGELKLSVADNPEEDLKAKLAQRQGVIDSFGSEGIGSNVLIGASEIREICPLLEGVGSGDLARPDRERGRDEVQERAAGCHAGGRRQVRARICGAAGDVGRRRTRSRDPSFLPAQAVAARPPWPPRTVHRRTPTLDRRD